ncbi:hypothetical protein Poli38472_002191 [Pythium oligandrum]|uniref:Uncharacterized protein n=1 Tax=Pythium oligandrum TaxID=41045 RepID=A0A8K1CHC7_PYTOL|nr:hypothetical protein Poli38472_002191 [Pythium oligandrum]|eukprot:TMW63250.1 hypothetical protein Poli38472_002191 [Pythium oligandrum]
MTPRARLLWLTAVIWSLYEALHVAASVCTRLWVPPASRVYTMVHLDDFDSINSYSAHLCESKRLPKYKCVDLLRELLASLEDMAVNDASEGLVNITLDYQLMYTVDVPVPDATHTVEKAVYIIPEVPISETVQEFCEEHLLSDAQCVLFAKGVANNVANDWGCLESEDSDVEAIASAQNEEQVDAAQGEQEAPTPAPSLVWLVPPLNPDDKPPSLQLEMEVVVDNAPRHISMVLDQDLELQAGRLCRLWELTMPNCAQLLRLMQERSDALALPFDTRLEIEITSPVRSGLYPRSEKVFINTSWPDIAVDSMNTSRQLCIFFDLTATPVHCGVFPPHDVIYFNPYTIPQGPHVLLLAEEANHLSKNPSFLAARHFVVTQPEVSLLDVTTKTLESGEVFFELRIETRAFDADDPRHRLCVLVDDAFDCYKRSKIVLESEQEVEDGTAIYGDNRVHIFLAPIFGLAGGDHEITVLLMNELIKAFAISAPVTLSINMSPGAVLAPRDPAYFHDLPTVAHIQRPTHCPLRFFHPSVSLGWLCELWRHEWGHFSQNGEDGVLASIFHHIGVQNRYYVEFGTETGQECNTRYWRQVYNWTGLLMDGRHADDAINLHQAWVTAENVNALFAWHNVPRAFDLLSIDVDFNDYWILNALDLLQFAPRVIVVEYNAHVPPNEARSVKYRPHGSWDGETDYFGTGVAALDHWARRNDYSLVYCESHGVNCFLVRNDALVPTPEASSIVKVSDFLRPEDVYAPTNFFGHGLRYPHKSKSEGAEWEWLDPVRSDPKHTY